MVVIENIVVYCFLPAGGGLDLPRGRRDVIVGAVFGAKERMAGVNNLLITLPERRERGCRADRRPSSI